MQENDNEFNVDEAIDELVSTHESDAQDTQAEDKEVSNETKPEDSNEVQSDNSDRDNSADEENIVVDDKDNAESDPKEEDQESYTINVNGKTENVSIDELVNGYQRQSDYTLKTQEIAEQKKQIQEQQEVLNSRIDEANNKLAEQVALQKIVSDKLGKLIKDNEGYLDPETFAKEQNYAIKDAQYELAESIKAQEVEQQKQQQEYIEKEIGVFYSRNPEYKGSEKEIGFQKYIADHQIAHLPISSNLLELAKEAYEGKQIKQKLENARISLKNKKVKKPVARYQKSSTNAVVKKRKTLQDYMSAGQSIPTDEQLEKYYRNNY